MYITDSVQLFLGKTPGNTIDGIPQGSQVF